MSVSSRDQQRSHVPKFGNWDKDNIPYTAYFENARKERSGVRMNPNDPEENPEAFAAYMKGEDTEQSFELSVVQSPIHPPVTNKTSWQRKARGSSSSFHKSITSESGYDKSNSEHYSMTNKAERSERKKATLGRDQSIQNLSAPSLSRHSRQRSSGVPSLDDNHHHRAESIPKFGAWDEADPKSGENFTVIFNKVKQQKQVNSETFIPNVYSQTQNLYHDDRNGHRTSKSSSPGSKFCCGLFSR